MTGQRPTRLLTITGPRGRADFAVSADSSLGELADLLAAELVASATTERPRWVLVRGGEQLPRDATSESVGLLDGDQLHLADAAVTAPAPVHRRQGPTSPAPVHAPRSRRFGSAAAG